MQAISRMNRMEFAKLMAKLRAFYQNAVTDEVMWAASVTAYWSALGGFPADDLRRVFHTAWQRFPDWMPSAGQLLSLVQGSKDWRVKAAESWPEVLRLAQRSSGDHSDPVAREAIKRMGGGKRLGQMSWDDLNVWGKKEFEQTYAELVDDYAGRQLRELSHGRDGGNVQGAGRQVGTGERDGSQAMELRRENA